MNATGLADLRKALHDSYLHRPSAGTSCSLCGLRDSQYAFHVIEYAQAENREHPNGFVAMSASVGVIRDWFRWGVVVCGRMSIF